MTQAKAPITCTSTHCERRQECASPNECTGSAKHDLERIRDAAPDLLAALQGMLTGLYGDGYAIPCGAVHTANARRAIARATGAA